MSGVAIAARRGERLEALASEITGAGGDAPIIIIQDMMEADAAANVASAALAGLGHVDFLINNAGGSRPFALGASEELWDEALTLNFVRHRQLTDQLLDQMIALKSGRIINITGKSEPEGVNGAFSAKAAMHAWAKGLSREVGKFGITVNSIPPGRIHSEQILRNYTPEYRQWAGRKRNPDGSLRRARGYCKSGMLSCFAAGRLYYRYGHPG